MPSSPDRLELSMKEPSSTSPTDSLEQRQQFGLNRRPVLSALPVRSNGSRDVSPDRLPSAVKQTGCATPQTDRMRITLIRRDPASGNQWNVGSISLPNGSSRTGALVPFGIEISSPGYVKFSVNEGAAGPTFCRQTGHMIVPNSTLATSGRKRSNSAELFTSATTAASRKPRQAYSFLSPWKGICSFSNGIDGRSLRCRHVLPSVDSSVPGVAADIAEVRFNLPWAKLRSKDTNPQQHSPLDSGFPSTSPLERPTMAVHKDQWRRSFQNFTTRAREQFSKNDGTGNVAVRSSRFDVKTDESNQGGDQEPEMKLDLGREKAGGGFKGHSAKLGKLIIEDEGLKMCDLVVAACMGVWWQHYSGSVSF
ncbi:hypothetical protein PV10_00343 [Exophiala mesophila]|uniref:Uncharacterized protein n=1 Tax=Exophiala mesophila TaxID=212818 RepID=A0A0D2AC33_EXOME|nr:uncharacterized protein PV10_00343 [Exophiala mesophila]KIV96473.1 hypothetical protein PV10_00343 [Exophiala mesophila]